jgi:hypothetical protein
MTPSTSQQESQTPETSERHSQPTVGDENVISGEQHDMQMSLVVVLSDD